MPAAGTFQTEIRADPQDLPLMAAARVRLFEFYNISNLVYHFLSPLLLPYTPTASPSTFPMLSLITRSA